MSIRSVLGLSLGIIFFAQAGLRAHCEIPCGIYGDEARFAAMIEDAKTIEKSVSMINQLSNDPAKNANQLTRWVMNKEDHANKIKETIAFYFLSQRIKAPEDNSKKMLESYHEKLAALHAVTVAAMKTKQTADPAMVKKLINSVNALEKLYFKGHKHKK